MKNKLTQYLKWDQYHYWYEFGGLALCILFPLFVSGYILTLDLVFTPHVAFPLEITNAWLLQVALWLCHFVLPMDLIEKCILFVILLCSGAGMYRLFLVLYDRTRSLRIGAYFAGLFYMINPFVYSRFMAGQWMVLLGYALLPFCIRSLYLFVQSPSLGRAISVTMWMVIMVSVSLHMVGIAVVAMGILLIAMYDHKWNKHHLQGLVIIVAVPALLSGFWLVPAMFGVGTIGESVTSFTKDHFAAFETVGGIGSVLRLQGFWVEARDLYVLPQAIVPLWGVWFLVLWGVVLFGIKHYLKTQRPLAIGLIVFIIIGVVVSTTPLILWVSQLIPQLAGYREPHKFVSLIAMSYAIFGGIGAIRIVSYWRRKHSEITVTVIKVSVLILPIIITPVMFWGFGGQLTPKAYPPEWYSANRLLKDQARTTKTLFLPWHQYANYSFSDRIIANPSEKFFETAIVASDQPEFKNLTPTRPDSLKRAVSDVLGDKKNVSGRLKQTGIDFIILAKEQDYRDYVYLDKDPGLITIQENAKLKIYKVK